MLTDARLFDLWSRESYASYTEAHKAFARAVEADLLKENNKLRTEITFLCNVWDRLDPKGYASYCENHE